MRVPVKPPGPFATAIKAKSAQVCGAINSTKYWCKSVAKLRPKFQVWQRLSPEKLLIAKPNSGVEVCNAKPYFLTNVLSWGLLFTITDNFPSQKTAAMPQPSNPIECQIFPCLKSLNCPCHQLSKTALPNLQINSCSQILCLEKLDV